MKTTWWRKLLGVLPMPMLGLVASRGVYEFGLLYLPEEFALAGAAAFESVYIGLAVQRYRTVNQRTRARNISRGAVAVSILYVAVAAYFYRNAEALQAIPWYGEVLLAMLHAVPLATLNYLVAQLLLHEDEHEDSQALATADELHAMPPSIAPRVIAVTRPRPPMQRRPAGLLEAPRPPRKVTVGDLRKAAATDPRAAEIIRMKDEERLTFAQIGEHFGFSHQHASNLYRTAKAKMQPVE